MQTKHLKQFEDFKEVYEDSLAVLKNGLKNAKQEKNLPTAEWTKAVDISHKYLKMSGNEPEVLAQFIMKMSDEEKKLLYLMLSGDDEEAKSKIKKKTLKKSHVFKS